MKSFFKKAGKVLGGLINDIMEDSISAYSAQAAFFVIISVFPLIMLLLTLLKFLPYFSGGVPLINIRFFPHDLNLFTQTVLQEIIDNSSNTVLSISAITAIWSSSTGVYSIMLQYREKGVCQRSEEVIPIENEYEHDKFLTGLIGIFNYVSQKVPLLIVLNKVHLASHSFYEFLYRFITDNPNYKIAIICTINEVFVVPDHIKSVKNDVFVMLEAKNMVQDWGIENKNVSPDENDIFTPQAEEFDRYLQLIGNMIEMCAITQAIYYCDMIKSAIDSGEITPSDELIHRFYRMYSDANFKSGNYPRTLTLCDERKGIVSSNTESALVDRFNFEYTYLVALCHSCAGQDKLAEKYAEDCSVFAKKTDDEYVIFKTELLKCMVKFRCWTNVYLWNVEFKPVPTFLENAEKYHYYNHLAYIYLFCFGNDRTFYDVDPNFCESHDHYKKGMQFADMLGNEAVKLRAYKKNVVFSSSFGYYPRLGEQEDVLPSGG